MWRDRLARARRRFSCLHTRGRHEWLKPGLYGRQKQLREFPYNAVHDAHAWSKLQIGNPRGASIVRDRIQSLPLQIKVHGVERVMEIEPWALAHVVKHDAACMERVGLYRLAVQPKFAGILSVYLYDDHIGVVARRRVGHGVKRHVEFAPRGRQG